MYGIYNKQKILSLTVPFFNRIMELPRNKLERLKSVSLIKFPVKSY